MPSHRIRVLIVLAVVAVLVASGIGSIQVRVAARPQPELATGLPDATVTIVGRADSFGALGGSTASGQSLALHPARGWSIPPGYAMNRPTMASDGSLLMPLESQSLNLFEPTGRMLGIATYRPADNVFGTVTIDRSGTGLAPSVAALVPVGDAVAFSVAAAPVDPDVAWPVLGVLSKVDGRWQVAGGDGWRNAWTAADLGLDAGALSMMVRLPGSGDLAALRNFTDGRPGAEIVTVRLAGPDATGRYSARLVARFRYDTGPLVVRAEHMAADPTRSRGDELFGLTLAPVVPDLPDGAEDPTVLQEFGYDADHGTLRLVSAPFVPGGRQIDEDLFGFAAFRYDRAGNLWAARNVVFGSGDLAVYTGPRCPPVAQRALQNIRSSAGKRTSWGEICQPAYDVAQGGFLGVGADIVEDGATGDLAVLALGGRVMTMRSTAAGPALGLQIGNLIDTNAGLLPLFGDLNHVWPDEFAGPVDAGHRMWITVRQKQLPPLKAVPDAPTLDQWLVAINLSDAFAPSAVEISDVPGQDTEIQAERTLNFGTRRVERAGAPVLLDSETFVSPCSTYPDNVACGYDGTPGAGFMLTGSRGLGHGQEPMDYRIRVPSAGNYRVGYRAYTFNHASFDLVAGGRSYRVSFDQPGAFMMIWLSQLVRLEAGEQTIRLVSAPDNIGWSLNSFVLRRA